MRPEDYFIANVGACADAREFCCRFSSMREAWMSDKCEVGWMLWAICRLGHVRNRLIVFLEFCARQAGREGPVGEHNIQWPIAYSLYAANSYAMRRTPRLESAALYLEARRQQQDKLRELFPEMFTGEKP